MPDGSDLDIVEVLNLKPDGTWTYDVPTPNPLGIHVFDEFHPEQTPEGTKLSIHSTLTPQDPSGATHMSALKEFMVQGWKQAAEICERDAP